MMVPLPLPGCMIDTSVLVAERRCQMPHKDMPCRHIPGAQFFPSKRPITERYRIKASNYMGVLELTPSSIESN